jgi:hypothetical protein
MRNKQLKYKIWKTTRQPTTKLQENFRARKQWLEA